MNFIDYSILSYGPSEYRIYSVDDINQSRDLMLEWLKKPGERRYLDPKLLNHHAWAVRVAKHLIEGQAFTLEDCILAKVYS